MKRWSSDCLFVMRVPATQAECPYRAKLVDDLVAGLPLPAPKVKPPRKKKLRIVKHSRDEVR